MLSYFKDKVIHCVEKEWRSQIYDIMAVGATSTLFSELTFLWSASWPSRLTGHFIAGRFSAGALRFKSRGGEVFFGCFLKCSSC